MTKETNLEFDLQWHINNWTENLKTQAAFTDSDLEELKSHLLDMMDGLKLTGLDDEEAFWVASKRMGSSVEWGEEFRQINNPVIQMRRSLFILAGVLAYFLMYYFIKTSSKLLFIVLKMNKTHSFDAMEWVIRYIISLHFLFILFFTTIYFFEIKTVSFIEKVKLKPKHTLFLLFITITLGISDTCLYPVAKNLLSQNNNLRSRLIQIFLYFDYSFPLIICICFIFLYFKYHKNSKF